MGFFVIKLFCTVFFLNCFIYADPEVTIEEGTLRGIVMKTWKQKEFYGFMGIPYAKPPVGKLRFAHPVEIPSWNNILNATVPKPICIQINKFINDYTVKGIEDCLYLNVYTPKKAENCTTLRPVMVFIHGGGFTCESGNPDLYSPSLLLEKDVLLVTINYRLGPLGFLSIGNNLVPGNNGLKDQNLALKWVKRNIKSFGGDPNKITLFGQSAGGASVHFHMVSPLSKDLFNYAIAQSGLSTSSWALSKNNETVKNSLKLAEYLNCNTNNLSLMIDCLRNVDAEDITILQKRFSKFYYLPMIPFKPVIEKNNDDAFLPYHPYDAIKSGLFADIPFITGLTSDDGSLLSSGLFNNSELIQNLNDRFNDMVPYILELNKNIPNLEEILHKIKTFYFDGKEINNAAKRNVSNFVTDAWGVDPLSTVIRLQFKSSKSPLYQYKFSYRGSLSYYAMFGDSNYDYGVCHCDELFYLFGVKLLNYIPPDHENVIQLMTTLWTNFAKTGNPTPCVDNIVKGVWEPYSGDALKYFEILNGNEMKMNDDAYVKSVEFWDKLNTRLELIKDEL